MRPKLPAVIVGGNLNALGVARSLARGNIPTIVLAVGRACPAAWSRHARIVRAPQLHGEILIDALGRLAHRLNCRPVLLLTQDASVLTVSVHRERLDPLYHIELPDDSIVRTLSDKLSFDSLAARESFAIPRSCALRGPEDLSRIGELAPPFVLKPADKTRALAGETPRTARAESLDQARELATHMLNHGTDVIVQEWIEGPDSEIYFTLFCAGPDGAPAGLFTGRKLLSTPPRVGSTALCVAAPECADVLERETREFLRRVPYRGLGSLEFKRDVRTGRFVMVEPTVGRTDWQEEIATLCGVNLPEIAYWLALGEIPPRVPSAPPACQLAWRADIEFGFPADFRGKLRAIDGHFRWSDPLPGIYHYAYERVIRRAGRRLRRAVRSRCKQQEISH